MSLMIARARSGEASLMLCPMDYPQQLKAINYCYVSHIRSDLKIKDGMLFECMKQQGFAFCSNCQGGCAILLPP